MARPSKKILFIPLLVLCQLVAPSKTKAQIDVDRIEAALTEGFTVSEMEDIWDHVAVSNAKEWMKERNYKLIVDEESLLEFEKNKLVSIVIYYREGSIKLVTFESSPQKYYRALRDLKEGPYTKIKTETKTDANNNEPYTLETYEKGNLRFDCIEAHASITIYRK